MSRIPANRLASAHELTTSQIAESLGVHVHSVLAYLNETRDGYPSLRGTKRGGAYFVKKTDLAAFLALWPNIPQKPVEGVKS